MEAFSLWGGDWDKKLPVCFYQCKPVIFGEPYATSSTVFSAVKAEWMFTTEKIADYSSAKIKASKNMYMGFWSWNPLCVGYSRSHRIFDVGFGFCLANLKHRATSLVW